MDGAWLPAVFAASAVLAALTAVGCWRGRGEHRALRAIALTSLGSSLWSASDALLLLDVPVAVRRSVLTPVLLVGVSLCVLGLWALPRLFADPSWRPGPRSALLLVEPGVVVLAAALPATAGLVYDQALLAAPAGAVRLVGGPLFTLHSLYAYGLILSAVWLMLRRRRSTAGDFRRQADVILIALLPPCGLNLVVLLAQPGGGVVDVSPIGLLFTSLICCYAVFRAGVMRLVPVARGQVVETISDAVVVSGLDGRVLDLNPAARRLLATMRPDLPEDLIGRPVVQIAGEDVLAMFAVVGGGGAEHRVEVRPGVHLDVRTTPVVDSRGAQLATISVIRDVSAEQKRVDAMAALNDQMARQLVVIEELRADLAEEAVRDHLTGLHNRRHLDGVLATTLLPAGAGAPVALLLLDIDHFKRVNDRFGHAAGDQVLRGVAGALRRSTRPGDIVARLGGEEFVLVLPGADPGRAMARADAVRQVCAAAVHRVEGGPVRVTVSVGVAVWTGEGGPAELLATADAALYAAKAQGRDRVVLLEGGWPDGAATAEQVAVTAPS